jgi:transposase-like protein
MVRLILPDSHVVRCPSCTFNELDRAGDGEAEPSYRCRKCGHVFAQSKGWESGSAIDGSRRLEEVAC